MNAKTSTRAPGAEAPLLSLPEWPFPEGGAVWYEGVGGRPMRAAYFPAAHPIGSVVVSPGRTEPIEKYVEVVGELVKRGFTVLIHDWRGQGHSSRLLPDRLRGHAEGYYDFIADFTRLLDIYVDRLPRPRIALGHSMGGCLTLTALARGERRFDAAILSAPMLGLNTGGRPAWQARLLARLMTVAGRAGEFVLGGGADPFTTTFEQDRLTHDRRRYDRARAQILADRDLALGSPTWGWLSAALKTTDWLRSGAEVTRISIPVVVVGAGDDALVLNSASKAVAARIPKGQYLEIPGAYHEILMEADELRAPFWDAFDRLAASL
ncbi:MAG: alpha/beta hydrolase [Caulobacteraceae bacterium]|nr:alpha/beta hydrolase [Caulobacteraceae bacterium]